MPAVVPTPHLIMYLIRNLLLKETLHVSPPAASVTTRTPLYASLPYTSVRYTGTAPLRLHSGVPCNRSYCTWQHDELVRPMQMWAGPVQFSIPWAPPSTVHGSAPQAPPCVDLSLVLSLLAPAAAALPAFPAQLSLLGLLAWSMLHMLGQILVVL